MRNGTYESIVTKNTQSELYAKFSELAGDYYHDKLNTAEFFRKLEASFNYVSVLAYGKGVDDTMKIIKEERIW